MQPVLRPFPAVAPVSTPWFFLAACTLGWLGAALPAQKELRHNVAVKHLVQEDRFREALDYLAARRPEDFPACVEFPSGAVSASRDQPRGLRKRECSHHQSPMMLAMCATCEYIADMSIMIQIRNVPDGLHRRLKARAALAGMSLSEYLLREVRHLADRPSPDEMRERLRRRAPVHTRMTPAKAIRAGREGR